MVSSTVILKRYRDVSLAVKNTPDIDVVGVLQIKDQVRKVIQRPRAQTRNIQFMRITRRSGSRIAADMCICPFQLLHKTQSRLLASLGQVIIDSIIDILIR